MVRNCLPRPRETGHCEFYPQNAAKLTRDEKYDFIAQLLSARGQDWLDLESYIELVCTHAQIPFYRNEIMQFAQELEHMVIAFSATGKKLTKNEQALYEKQISDVESWINDSCYDIAIPALDNAWEVTHRILPHGYGFQLRGGKDPLEAEIEKDLNRLFMHKKGNFTVYLPYATEKPDEDNIEFSDQKYVKIYAQTQDEVDNLNNFYEELGYTKEIKVKNRVSNVRNR